MTQEKKLEIDIVGGRETAGKIINLIQTGDDSLSASLSGLAIAYATLCVAEGIKLYDCMELVMTVYKHTRVIGGRDNDVDVS